MSTISVIPQSMFVLGSMGLVVGVVLLAAASKFKVQVDPIVENVIEVLPGANCGACGSAGCPDFAEKVVQGDVPVSGCPFGGQEVAQSIGQILGKSVDETEKKIPYVVCNGGIHCRTRFDYVGIEDCRAVKMLSDGQKDCEYGCLGQGSCVRACPFGAIEIGDDNLPHIVKHLCKSCGLCIDACPNNVLAFAGISEAVHVRCKSNDKGKRVKEICEFGCIGCRICVKNCPVDAITIDGFLARIDQAKCTRCGICAEKCPQKSIGIVQNNMNT